MWLIIFFLGLVVGSFLNALIYRLHSGESMVFKRSHCIYCEHPLDAFDLVPIFSFIWLQGRCRYCRKDISWQYPIVEFITAVIFVLFAQNFFITPEQFPIFNFHFWAQIAFACILIVIAVFDLKHYLILDKVIFPTLVFSLIYNFISDLNFGCSLVSINCQLGSGIFAAVIISGFFALQYYFSKGRWIGFGDVKFGLLLGSILGFKLGLGMLMLAYCLGALTGVILIALGKKHLSSHMPFGTFLSISAIIMMLYGQSIIDWYFGLLGL